MLQMYFMTIFLLNDKIQDNCYASETPVGERRKKKLACLLFDLLLTVWFLQERNF